MRLLHLVARFVLCAAVARAVAPPPLAASTRTSLPVAGATITLDVTPAGQDTVPIQLMAFGHPNAMGMSAVPDMHTAVMQQPDGSYKLWIAGRFLGDSIEGSTGPITTTDFRTFGSGPGNEVVPDLVPTCRGATESTGCWNNFDAVYAGADLVWRGTDGDLRMLYHGACGYFGGLPPDSSTATWCQVGLARSSDNGASWSAGVPVISGSDLKPTTDPVGIFGAVEPGAILANGYVYCFYSFFSLPGPNKAPPAIQVARAPLSGDGAPGTWTKYWNGSFSESALLAGPGTTSLGSPVVPTIDGCTRPAQPWPVYSAYLNLWVLVYVGTEGWFFTTSPDLVHWNLPVRFFPFQGDPPLANFADGAETYENVILVTPGSPEGVIGQTGLVLYAYTPSWGHNAHMLWSRPFRFDFSAAGVAREQSGTAPELSGIRPNPVRRSAAIEYRLPEAGPVTLRVYDVDGRLVADLVNEVEPAGAHSIEFRSLGLAPGVYECRLMAGRVSSRRALVVMR